MGNVPSLGDEGFFHGDDSGERGRARDAKWAMAKRCVGLLEVGEEMSAEGKGQRRFGWRVPPVVRSSAAVVVCLSCLSRPRAGFQKRRVQYVINTVVDSIWLLECNVQFRIFHVSADALFQRGDPRLHPGMLQQQRTDLTFKRLERRMPSVNLHEIGPVSCGTTTTTTIFVRDSVRFAEAVTRQCSKSELAESYRGAFCKPNVKKRTYIFCVFVLLVRCV